MNAYQIWSELAKRYLYGSLHHKQLGVYFDMLGAKEFSKKQREQSLKELEVSGELDKMVVRNTKRPPMYDVNVRTVLADIVNMPSEQIKQQEKELLKKGFDDLEKYEKDTLKILESLEEPAKALKDENLENTIQKLKYNGKSELEENDYQKKELEKHNFDYEKFKKEKGDYDMYSEMQRGRGRGGRGGRGRRGSRMEMDWDDMEEMEREKLMREGGGMESHWGRGWGWRQQFPWQYFPMGLPLFMEDDLDDEFMMQQGGSGGSRGGSSGGGRGGSSGGGGSR